jgi:methylated-DNA-[protein]-cysteine S-methyltransferase
MPVPDGWLLALRCKDTQLVEAEFVRAGELTVRDPETDCARAAAAAAQIYFSSGQALFNLDLQPAGTAFQQRVWQALCAIPSGQTRTYGSLAVELGSSARAVAGACRDNPIPFFIPCHRVVAAHGLGGFMGALDGAPLRLKQWLLTHEGAV